MLPGVGTRVVVAALAVMTAACGSKSDVTDCAHVVDKLVGDLARSAEEARRAVPSIHAPPFDAGAVKAGLRRVCEEDRWSAKVRACLRSASIERAEACFAPLSREQLDRVAAALHGQPAPPSPPGDVDASGRPACVAAARAVDRLDRCTELPAESRQVSVAAMRSVLRKVTAVRPADLADADEMCRFIERSTKQFFGGVCKW